MDRLIKHRHIYQLTRKDHQRMKLRLIVQSTNPTPFIVAYDAVHLRASIYFLKDGAALRTPMNIIHPLSNPFVH